MNRWHLLAIVVLAGAGYVGVAYAKAQPVGWALVLSASAVAAILGAIVWVFDRWLWRLGLLHPWFVPFPDINGKWTVRTSRSWLTHSKDPAFTGTAEIEQRFFSIFMRIVWDDGSRSALRGRVPVAAQGGLYAFAAVVSNAYPVDRKLPNETKTAGFFFHEQDRKPDMLQIFYSTDGLGAAVIELTRAQARG